MAGKCRETAQNYEVDLAGVEPEINFSSEDLFPGVDLFAVVKADRFARNLRVVTPSAALNSRRIGVHDNVGATPPSALIQKRVDDREFRPPFSRKAIADRIQAVEADESVDYGSTWSVRRWGQLATIPGGAAGGYSVIVRTGRGSSYRVDLPPSSDGYAWTS